MEAIQRHPEGFALVRGEVRRALVMRFPYAVFFTIESDRIVVLTIMHTSRNPEAWPGGRIASGPTGRKRA